MLGYRVLLLFNCLLTTHFPRFAANGVAVLRANIETHYGIVHIIDGLMDRPRLTDACPSLRERLSSPDQGQQVDSAAHSISLRKVPDEELLIGASIKNNQLDNGLVDVVVPFPADGDSAEDLSKYGNKQFSRK